MTTPCTIEPLSPAQFERDLAATVARFHRTADRILRESPHLRPVVAFSPPEHIISSARSELASAASSLTSKLYVSEFA